MFCHQCGARVDEGEFCGSCGAPLRRDRAAPASLNGKRVTTTATREMVQATRTVLSIFAGDPVTRLPAVLDELSADAAMRAAAVIGAAGALAFAAAATWITPPWVRQGVATFAGFAATGLGALAAMVAAMVGIRAAFKAHGRWQGDLLAAALALIVPVAATVLLACFDRWLLNSLFLLAAVASSMAAIVVYGWSAGVTRLTGLTAALAVPAVLLAGGLGGRLVAGLVM